MSEEELSSWLDTFRSHTPRVLKLPSGTVQHSPLARALTQVAQSTSEPRLLPPNLPPPLLP